MSQAKPQKISVPNDRGVGSDGRYAIGKAKLHRKEMSDSCCPEGSSTKRHSFRKTWQGK
jgi:hypothetical protein